MCKFMLSVGLLLGALTSLGSAAQTGEERGLANQFQASTLAQAGYYEGQYVWIYWPKDGKWYAGKILTVDAGAYLVRYAGFGPEWNEWVYSDRLKPR